MQVAKELSEKLPSVRLHVFSDRDLEPKRSQIEAALESADVFFGSLLFDYDQVEWLKGRVDKIPVRLVFESALELMSSTQIGTFQVHGFAGLTLTGSLCTLHLMQSSLMFPRSLFCTQYAGHSLASKSAAAQRLYLPLCSAIMLIFDTMTTLGCQRC